MNQRNLGLGSAAVIALSGALLAATPSASQPLPRESTPAERAQTEQLNAKQAAQPDVVVTVLPDNRVPAGVAAYNDNVAQANARAQAQYDAQLKAYQNRQQDYEQRHEAYREQLDAYKEQLDNPPVVIEEHHVIVDQPAVVTVEPAFPGRDLVALDRLDNPDREIGGFPVFDRAGYLVGHFRHMTYQDEGREKALITLKNNKTIAITGDHLRLDATHDTVVADLTYDELNSMPARF